MAKSIERLAAAIEYPEAIPEGAVSAVFRVDGEAIRAEEVRGELLLTAVLDRSEEDLAALAELALGRILREEAVLAWDVQEEAVVLWQGCPAEAERAELRAFFEAFTTAVDWWRERASALHAPPPAFPQMVIHP